MKWFKNNLPGTYNFFLDFFQSMNNSKSGHSLRKWLAVGFYWIMFKLSMSYTTEANVTAVLAIHAGMITALIITYTAGNIAQNKINKTTKPEEDEATEQG